jgi:hypothetical protein
MKFDTLRSIGHNIADSLGSGVGLLIGVYEMDVFGEAAGAPDGTITVDFLLGTATGGMVSDALAVAITKYRDALGSLCAKHGASVSDFRQLSARYTTINRELRISVIVEDRSGHHGIDEYVGIPARHVRVLDAQGRVRTKRRPSAWSSLRSPPSELDSANIP